MLTFSRLLSVLLCAFCMNWAVSCKPSASVSDKAVSETERTDTISATKATSNNAIKELGLLKNVEDSGYPFSTLTIEFPERHLTEYFTLNLEAVKSINAETLSKLVGKYVSFEYTSDLTNALLDLTLNGKSLLNAEKSEELAGAKTITGMLSNAAEETAGDLPGELFIVTEEEITEKFPFFITPEIVKANGKKVVGYYQQRTQNTITSLEAK